MKRRAARSAAAITTGSTNALPMFGLQATLIPAMLGEACRFADKGDEVKARQTLDAARAIFSRSQGLSFRFELLLKKAGEYVGSPR